MSYANVAATLALVFSMSGGALAAKHYLINSTKQLSPKVLKKLKGHDGQNGATGPTGFAGLAGREGLAGKEGAAGREGPAGKEGIEGKEGKPGTALAWAFMDFGPKLRDAHNFSTTYTNPATGVYCFTPTGGVSPSTSPIALITVEHDSSMGSELFAYASGAAKKCEAGQYEVLTYDGASKESDSIAFYIVIPG